MDEDTKKAFRLCIASIDKLIKETTDPQQRLHLKVAKANILRVFKIVKGEWKP